MPGSRTTWAYQSGEVSIVWLQFLRDLHERTGGGATDKIDDIATGITDGANSADNLMLHWWMSD